MKTTTPVLLVLVAALSACASPGQTPPLGLGFASSAPPMRLIEGPSVPPPVHDVGEARRREWYDANRPQVAYAPIENFEATGCSYGSDCGPCHGHGWGLGWLPISLGIGWSGGGHCGGGFGIGLGLGFGFGCW